MLEWPRWSVAGTAVFVADYDGDAWNPNISQVSLDPLQTIVKVSRSAARELTLFQVRPDPVNTEVLVYGGKEPGGANGSKCRDLRVSRSWDGLRLNSATRLLLGGGASQLSTSATTRQVLLDGGKESKTGACSSTGTILRATDNGSTVQTAPVTSGYLPATP